MPAARADTARRPADLNIASIETILSRHPKTPLAAPSLTPAAVMLLIYARHGEYHILLNKRSKFVDMHKSEIAFPGGRRDPGDVSLLATALRETHEEMGVLPQDVAVLGELDDVATISNFVVTPFVGTIPSPYPFKPSAGEVAEVIEVPLGSLLHGKRHRGDGRLAEGGIVARPAYAFDGHLIFGATATILGSFLDLLADAPDKESAWKRKQP